MHNIQAIQIQKNTNKYTKNHYTATFSINRYISQASIPILTDLLHKCMKIPFTNFPSRMAV